MPPSSSSAQSKPAPSQSKPLPSKADSAIVIPPAQDLQAAPKMAKPIFRWEGKAQNPDPKFYKATLITKMSRGYLTRKRTMELLEDIPHSVYATVISAEGLPPDEGMFGKSPPTS